jgi:uncharacterized protein YecE (DUF72 family)
MLCWAGRNNDWTAAAHDVFAYFNNDGQANAVRNARTLRAQLAADGAGNLAARAASVS